MARSSHIYHAYYDEPFAAFTVKHELVTWLEKNPDMHTGLKIVRTNDGAPIPSIPNPEPSHSG